MLACGDVRMRMGAMVVEASVAKVGKDDAIRALRARMASAADAKHVCVVALGDDVTDEDAFGALEAHDVGIKVGTGPTLARYRVASVARVCEALWALALLREASCDELQVGSITDR
jgi:trehalose 6-phosphate phosphatase